jgi:hypothetical protein
MRSFLSFLLVGNVILATAGCAIAQDPCLDTPLVIKKEMVVNEVKRGDPWLLFDEAEIAKDPKKKDGGKPVTMWSGGAKPHDHPVSAYVNFGNPVKISSIFLYDINNKGAFRIETGEPGKWKELVIDSLKGFHAWNQHTVETTTQYLRFYKVQGGANVGEVVIYGCKLPDGGAPAKINDLSIHHVSDHYIRLLWTATGDDGNYGAATSHEIRYSTSPIKNLKDFRAATRIGTDLPIKHAGVKQTLIIRDLLPNTTYYFAVQATDDEGNKSPLSNIAQATTLASFTREKIPMDQFIGANSFVDDPAEIVKAVGFIREYHNWRWDEGGSTKYKGFPNNEIKWAPSYSAKGTWNFDKFYQRLNDDSIGVSPVFQGNVPWLQGHENFPFDDKPLDSAHFSSTDPNSYKTKAHHLYQFAARFGNTKVDDKKLTLAKDQERRTGLGLIHYMEDWNEQNKYWLGPNAEFSPQEYAAMASANYDGHANTMKGGNNTFGIKNADPTMKFVMGGIARIDMDWIKQMQEWFENNRPDHKYILDVINVHYYTWANGKSWQGGGPAKGPEEDQLKERLQALTAYRDQNLPEAEVWISEFGWDTNPKSPLCVPTIPPFDTEEVQAQWLIRAYLAFAAAGVDRAQMYMIRDVNSASGHWFNSSGLVGEKDVWTPKKSWYYVYTLKNTLKHMIFLEEEKSTDEHVLIYKFKRLDSSRGAYVIWAKTKENYVVNNYELALPKNTTTATMTEFIPDNIHGNTTTLKMESNKIHVSVSERPIIIAVDYIE